MSRYDRITKPRCLTSEELKRVTVADLHRPLSDSDDSHRHKGSKTSEKHPSVNVDAESNLKFIPFPVESIPQPVQGFVGAASKAIGCDPSFIAITMLVVCAAAIGNSRRVRLKPGWIEPCVIWAAIIAYSGDHKSPALSTALSALRKRQQKKIREYEKEYERWLNHELAKYEADLSSFKKSKLPGKEPPQKPAEPIPWRLLVDDVTLEALADILRKQPRGLLLAVDELAAWLGGMERYKKGSDLAKWLEVHGGRALIIDRKTGSPKTLFIPHASVSIIGGIQPETYKRQMNSEMRATGADARILKSFPPRRPRTWTDASIHPDAEKTIEALMDRLLSLEMQLGETDTDDPMPVLVDLDGDARSLFVRFVNEHAEEQSAETGDLCATWSKLEGYCPRLALVHHLIRWANGDIHPDFEFLIDAESMQAGIDLVRWFSNEARRIDSMISETPEQQLGRELIDWIQRRGGETSVRDLMRHQFKYSKSADKARADLEALVKAGVGKWRVETTPGRPMEVFFLESIDHRHRQKPESFEESDPSVNALGGRYWTDAEINAPRFESDGGAA